MGVTSFLFANRGVSDWGVPCQNGQQNPEFIFLVCLDSKSLLERRQKCGIFVKACEESVQTLHKRQLLVYLFQVLECNHEWFFNQTVFSRGPRTPIAGIDAILLQSCNELWSELARLSLNSHFCHHWVTLLVMEMGSSTLPTRDLRLNPRVFLFYGFCSDWHITLMGVGGQ